MTDLEPPSFSLGIEADFENDAEAELDEFRNVSDNLNLQSCVIVDSDIEEEEQNEQPSAFSFPSSPKFHRKKLKRLRRGQLREDVSMSGNISDVLSPIEEDIEEFSQDELASETPNSTLYNSVCSSSKIRLHSSTIQTNHSSSFQKSKTKDQNSTPLLSSSLDLGYNGVMLPKLTISPLRRFQLIDSDSDLENPPSPKTKPRKESIISSSSNINKKAKNSEQNPDLWKDFEPLKTSRIETPALDEMCNEYFNSLQRSAGPKHHNTAFHRFPSHHYYFNDDERIRKLLSSRLPHFTPLTGETHRSNINYIGQFKGNAPQLEEASTSKPPRRGKRSTQGSSDKPKNVRKRRVLADESQGSGHWYTSSDGKRVYVPKTGKALSGQSAYRFYKKETGGFRKSKNKVKGKRKN